MRPTRSKLSHASSRRVALLAACWVLLPAAVAPLHSQEPGRPAADSLVDVRVVTDQADAVLALLARRASGEALADADWDDLQATEGYQRLKDRSESFGAEEFDTRFRDWILTADLTELEVLRSGVDGWRALDATAAGRTALAYLPEGTRLRTTIYPVLKSTPNSFVFEVDTDPAIFMYVSGTASESELANTLAHELHHIGAGGPHIHPHAARSAEEWAVWERDVAQFNRDLGRIEQFFLDILAGELDADAQRPRFMELINTEEVPQGAFYTVGWKMGALVEQSFGRQAVVEAICDMRRLLVSYNEIANAHPRGDGGSLATWGPELLEGIGAVDP